MYNTQSASGFLPKISATSLSRAVFTKRAEISNRFDFDFDFYFSKNKKVQGPNSCFSLTNSFIYFIIFINVSCLCIIIIIIDHFIHVNYPHKNDVKSTLFTWPLAWLIVIVCYDGRQNHMSIIDQICAIICYDLHVYEAWTYMFLRTYDIVVCYTLANIFLPYLSRSQWLSTRSPRYAFSLFYW